MSALSASAGLSVSYEYCYKLLTLKKLLYLSLPFENMADCVDKEADVIKIQRLFLQFFLGNPVLRCRTSLLCL